MPADDSTVIASAVRNRILQGYSDRTVREGMTELAAGKQDLDEILRLQESLKARSQPLESVLARLEAVRKRSPRYLEAYLLNAAVLRQRFWSSRDQNDLESALELVEEARKLAPNDPRPLFELIDVALDARKLDVAEQGLSDLTPLVPEDARLKERQARLLGARGQTTRALELMREAARLQPSNQRLHNLAQLELRQGQADAARKTLETLLERSPRHFDGLFLLAQIELSTGNLDRAIERYRELVGISPGVEELTNLGLAYLFKGRHKEAAGVFHRAFEIQPAHPALGLNLADALLLLGQEAQARALYQRVLDLIESDSTATGPEFLTVKAQALAHLGRGPQAVTALQEAMRLAPDQGNVCFEAALVYALLGEEDSAIASAEKAVHLGIGERWFSLPWFSSLRGKSGFDKLMQQARPGL